MTRYLTIAIALTGSLTMAATDYTHEVQTRNLPINAAMQSQYDCSPGLMAYRDSLSLSQAYANADCTSSDNTSVPQEGTGHRGIELGASSYRHLDSVSTVWGDARFAYGRMCDIRWSDCIDYALIAPYVLGDDTGGDLNYRRYIFGGGYSRVFNDRLALGASIDYRAEIAWRPVDPRVKDIVSDLQLSAGAGYRYSAKHLIGVSATVRTYSQDCDLDFYNPINDINTLPMTGLGTYYKRFAGNTNKNSGHSGLGYAADVRWITTDGCGWQATVRLDGIRMGQQLRNFNNITLAYTDTHRFKAGLYYLAQLSAVIRAMPSLTYAYSHRLGTENIFGTAQGASYDKIGSRRPYLHETAAVSLAVPVEFKVHGAFLTVTPYAEYCDNHESMSATVRSVDDRYAAPGILADYSVSGRRGWLWRLEAGCTMRRTLTSECRIPGYDPESALQASVVSAYNKLASDYVLARAVISVYAPVAGYLMGVSAGYSHINYNGYGASDTVNASVTLTF